MSIILFIAILAVLILFHELGHFLAARSVGARVDEFGIGFPPRAWSFRPKGSETEYSVNWVPFGGFVRIFGENGLEDQPAGGPQADISRSLTSKNRLAQAWVLAAGVLFNVLMGWVFLSIAFMSGVPTSVTPETRGIIGEPGVMILDVFDDAPAREAGLMQGDIIRELAWADPPAGGETRREASHDVAGVQAFIAASAGTPLVMSYEREGELSTLTITPDINEQRKGVIGVSLDLIGTVKLAPLDALLEGARTTGRFLVSITVGLGSFVRDAFSGTADYTQVAGPVGIVGMVGNVSEQGFVALLSFAAIISLNLAIINLVPFPALDGGRLLFIAMEAVTRRPLPAKMTQWANIIGFGILILLMILITVNDVINLL